MTPSTPTPPVAALGRLLAGTPPAQLYALIEALYGAELAARLPPLASLHTIDEALVVLQRGILDERLLLAVAGWLPAQREEIKGLAAQLGQPLSETALMAHTARPVEALDEARVAATWASLLEQQRRVSELLHGPINALVVQRLTNGEDRAALLDAADAVRAWAEAHLSTITLPDVREAIEGFVAMVPAGAARPSRLRLAPFLAETWQPRIATLRQFGQLSPLTLRRLAEAATATGSEN